MRLIVVPLVLFVAALALIVAGIETMSTVERNDAAHARLLGCSLVRTPDTPSTPILFFRCKRGVEIHERIDWASELARVETKSQ